MAMVLCLAVGFVMTKPGSKSISEVEEVQQKSASPSLWEEYRQEQLRNYKEEQGDLIKKSNEEAMPSEDVADTTDSHTSIISIEENAYNDLENSENILVQNTEEDIDGQIEWLRSQLKADIRQFLKVNNIELKGDTLIDDIAASTEEKLKQRMYTEINKEGDKILEDMENEIIQVAETEEQIGESIADIETDIEDVESRMEEDMKSDLGALKKELVSSVEDRLNLVLEDVIKEKLGIDISTAGPETNIGEVSSENQQSPEDVAENIEVDTNNEVEDPVTEDNNNDNSEIGDNNDADKNENYGKNDASDTDADNDDGENNEGNGNKDVDGNDDDDDDDNEGNDDDDGDNEGNDDNDDDDEGNDDDDDDDDGDNEGNDDDDGDNEGNDDDDEGNDDGGDDDDDDDDDEGNDVPN
eukprot:CAMPEP_0194392972 /NCGR_PEP_ID=MMETSP0174-20130528/123035_1 /TAXON_ID=216777 /ORGANISM="Proboscia alata, Strain PI-D3" /LENGTH=411 /DNA_ID=CAMNT_0039188597 /DNA_START=369 /DNA_END=1604 /DNA_ORIENTATION=+